MRSIVLNRHEALVMLEDTKNIPLTTLIEQRPQNRRRRSGREERNSLVMWLEQIQLSTIVR